MIDNILSAAALALFAAVTLAAVLPPEDAKPAATVQALPVVTLPAVHVVATRHAPATAPLLAEVE